MTIGQELREYRLQASLSQEQLAFRAGLSRNYISLLELDHKSPTLDTLAAICRELGTHVSVLIAQAERRQTPAAGKSKSRQSR